MPKTSTRYLKYEEIVQFLRECEKDYPDAFSHHTYGGDILRPRTAGPDLDMNPQDLDALKSMGRR